MNYTKNLLLLITLLLCNFTFAGGLKPGAFDEAIKFFALLFIGIPILVGTLFAIFSKKNKLSHFFASMFVTILILILISIMTVS